jgi:Putative zinc-finger
MRLTCKEASRLISLGLDRKLSLGQRTSLRLHLTMCAACTKLKAQFEFMRRALSAYGSGGPQDDVEGKSNTAGRDTEK